MDVPIQTSQDHPFHLLDVLRAELPPAQIGERRQLYLANLVDLDGDVERSERREKGGAAVASVAARGEVPIEERHGHGHDLARQVEVIDHVETPMADLLPPRGIQRRYRFVGGGGARKRRRRCRERRREFVRVVIIVRRPLLTAHRGESIYHASSREVTDDVAAYATLMILRVE